MNLAYCYCFHPSSDPDSKRASLAAEVGRLVTQQLVRAVHQMDRRFPALPSLPRRIHGHSLGRRYTQAGSQRCPLWGSGPARRSSDWLQVPEYFALIR